MQDNKASQTKVVAGLRQAARQLIALMDTTTDREERHLLAAQAFELLRQASQLAQIDEKRAAEVVHPSTVCSKARLIGPL